jgi:IclR family pca regulon transcriptional regulator
VLDGTDVVYVAKMPGTWVMTSTHSVGMRVPAYPTSMGRVLLAALAPAALDDYFAEAEIETLTRHTVTDERKLREALKQIATQGFSVVDQELEEGLRSIAVPVRDKTGGVVAALTVCSNSSRVGLDAMIRDFLPTMREAAAGLSAVLSR